MEEAKTQEISKLRSTLEEMRLRFEEVKQFPTDIGKTASAEGAKTVENASLQSAEKIAAEVLVAQQVIDRDDPEVINKLTDENAKLKVKL